MQLFIRYVGVVCKELGCGDFIEVLPRRQTPHPRHFTSDVTLNGDVYVCSRGHRHTYFSRDIAETSSPDGKGAHYHK
jgi:hypothetical protein